MQEEITKGKEVDLGWARWPLRRGYLGVSFAVGLLVSRYVHILSLENLPTIKI